LDDLKENPLLTPRCRLNVAHPAAIGWISPLPVDFTAPGAVWPAARLALATLRSG
jgi:hypothetical protein